MRVAIVHYHAGPGGVWEVIRCASRELDASGVRHVVLAGSAPQETSPGPPVTVVPGLGYGEGPVRVEQLLERLIAAAAAALGGIPDLWHFHNHSLGKNPQMHELVSRLACAHARLLLQIHDLAEDGRAENATRLAGAAAPYPAGPLVHYAFLNARDRDGFLQAGLEASRAHLLPNPCDARPAAVVDASEPPLVLYPVRGIRRKNLGEFLLLAALAPPGARFAVTRAPLDPAARRVHDGWRRFAHECGLAVAFDVVGNQEPSPRAGRGFDDWCDRATHFASTSVSEGFGMIFPESIARGKPLLGRRLAHLAADHAALGMRFPLLYDGLWIPADWLDREILLRCLHEAAAQLWGAWGREAPEAARILSRLERGCGFDFGNLPEVLQQRAIRRAMQPGMSARPMLERGGLLVPAAEWLVDALANRSPAVGRLPAACKPSAYRERLLQIYQLLGRQTATRSKPVDAGKILDSYLSCERFHFLTSPAPTHRPPPDFTRYRAIIFDVYGTLLECAAGGVRPDEAADPALRAILARHGHAVPDSPTAELHAAVCRHHAANRQAHPEVDLRELWRELLALPAEVDLTDLVIELEAARQPARRIDGVEQTLRALAAAGIPLGILSNAQCNTLPSLDGLAEIFAPELIVLSYQHGVAKPSQALFGMLVSRLRERGIAPAQTLYIGNDPLHDIEPAAGCGFHTALFTGHATSFRAGACFPDYEIRAWAPGIERDHRAMVH